MSDPGTNLEKQKSRHRPALVGMGIVMAFVAIIFMVYLVIEVDTPPGPDRAAETVEVGPGL